MLIHELLRRTADLYPSKAALIGTKRCVDYRDLEHSANTLFRVLQEHGIGGAAHVAVCVQDAIDSVIALFGISKAGCVCVPINPYIKQVRFKKLLEHSCAVALIADARLLERMEADSIPDNVKTVLATNEVICTTSGASRSTSRPLEFDPNGKAGSKREENSIDIDPALLLYTSGSTGLPKGVILTHLNVLSASASIVSYLGNGTADRILNVLPLFHSYGLTQVITAVYVGATLLLDQSLIKPRQLAAAIMQQKVTGLPVVPSIMGGLLDLDSHSYDLSTLRYVTNAAGPLPAAWVTRFRAMYPSVKLFCMYGLTECIRVSYLPPDEVDGRPSSVGRPMKNVEAYVVGDDGLRAEPGVVGELVVRGSNVMSAYWRDAEQTKQKLRPTGPRGEKLLFTGDLFKMDRDGFLYFISRKDDMIKTCGENVSPVEIEEVILRLSGVAEVAVVGVFDEIMGQAIKAVVTLKQGAQMTEGDIVRHCAKYLEPFMVPTIVQLRDFLQRTASGKLNKGELLEAG